MVTDHLQSVIESAMLTVPEGIHVRSIRLFGSRLRGDHREDSDYDFIVDADQTVGIFGLVSIQQALELALAAKVDLFTPNSVHPVLKKNIFSLAQKVYEG